MLLHDRDTEINLDFKTSMEEPEMG